MVLSHNARPNSSFSRILSRILSRSLSGEEVESAIADENEVYIHRIGRTARAGKAGEAWTFVTPDEGDMLTNVELLANTHIPELEYPDFVPSEPPRKIRDEQEAKKRDLERMRSVSRFDSPPPPQVVEKVDESKFPGGLVPTRMPPKRMGGKVITARAQKAILAEKKAKDEN